MAGNNTSKHTPESLNQQNEKGVENNGKLAQLTEACKTKTATALKTLALATSLTCATPAMAQNNQDALEHLKPGTESTVVFKGGGQGVLKIGKNGEYYLEGLDSEDGKDIFEGTTTIAGEKYLVISTGPDYPLEVIAEKDAHIYKEYADKLPEGLEQFAYELFKARTEFIANIVNTKRFERYKTPEKKQDVANRVWDGLINQLTAGKEYTGYEYVPPNAPGFTKYILTNYDELSGVIGQPIVAIRDEYEIMENNRIAEENNRIAEENNRITEEYKRKTEAYKKVLKHVGK